MCRRVSREVFVVRRRVRGLKWQETTLKYRDLIIRPILPETINFFFSHFADNLNTKKKFLKGITLAINFVNFNALFCELDIQKISGCG